jgi:hypothetical protein
MEDLNPLNPDAINDIRFLRDVMAKTHPPAVNNYWSVTLMWGCVLTFGYIVCAWLGVEHKVAVIPWVMPALIYLVALPLNWYFRRRVRSGIEDAGVRDPPRKDLMCLWVSVTVVGCLWTAALIVSGEMAAHWYLVVFVWASLYVVGFVMNGVLLSGEWFWAAGIMLASLIAALLAGPNFYWLPGFSIGGTMILAGLMGRQNARRQPAAA